MLKLDWGGRGECLRSSRNTFVVWGRQQAPCLDEERHWLWWLGDFDTQTYSVSGVFIPPRLQVKMTLRARAF